MDTKAEQEAIARSKAQAISKIAESKSFIVITDNGEKEKNLNTTMMINSLISAFEFLKIVKQVEMAILYPSKPTPPPSNIIKP